MSTLRVLSIPVLAGLLLGVCLPAVAAAQETPPSNKPEEETASAPQTEATETGDEEEERPDAVVREHLVVTATRIETPSSQIGSTVTVIMAEELERKQHRLVVDALREVPGVDIRRNGPPGSVTSLFLRGTDSDHTLVLLDGIELNDPSSPSRNPFLDHLTTDAVERIEVVRGPQSTLYGSDALGGVVQIITQKGQGAAASTLWAEAGSFSTVRAGFGASGGGDAVDFSTGASYTETDGFSASSTGTEEDGYRNATLAARLGRRFSESSGLDLSFRHSDAEIEFDGFLAEEDHLIDAGQTTAKAEPHFSLFEGRWHQRWSLRMTRHERDTQGSFPTAVEGELYAVGWQNDLRVIDDHTLTFGLESEWEKAELAGFDDSANTLALYAQDQLAVGQRFFGTVGLRADDHSEFGTEVTYRVALGYRMPQTRTTLRGSFGTAFKAPSLAESNETAFGGNPDLEPERSQGFDVGVEQTFVEDRFSLGVTYFQNDIDDLIVAVFDLETKTFLNLNVDRAETRGLEAFFAFRPATVGLTVRGTYTYTDTEAKGQPAGFGLTEGSRLLRRPDHKGSLDVAYRFVGHRAGVTLGLLYVGERADIDPVSFVTTEADEYFLVNLSASYDLAANLRLFARIDNLLDEEYEDVLGFSTADLSGYGGLRIRF